MNRIYRVVFNKTLNVMQAVSELQRRHGSSKSSVTNEGASQSAFTTWSKALRLAPMVLALGLTLGMAPSAFANPPCNNTESSGGHLIVCTYSKEKGGQVQYINPSSGTTYQILDGSKADGNWTQIIIQNGNVDVLGTLSSLNGGLLSLGFNGNQYTPVIVLKGGNIISTAQLNIWGGATIKQEGGHKIIVKKNSVYFSGQQGSNKTHLEAPIEFQQGTGLTFGGASFSEVEGAETNIQVTGDDTTLQTQGADTFTGGSVVSKFGNLVVKNTHATLSGLPKASLQISPDSQKTSTVTYTGSGSVSSSVEINTGGKLITSGSLTAPTISGDGSLQVNENGSVVVNQSLATSTTVDSGAHLTFKGTNISDLQHVTNSGDVTVASPTNELGDVTALLHSNQGTINLGDGTDEVTYNASKLDDKVLVSDKAVVNFTGTTVANLGSPTVNQGGTLKLGTHITDPVDLSNVKGEGTVEVAAAQTSSNLGTTVTVKVDPSQSLTYTGTAENLTKAKTVENQGTVVLDKANENWSDAIGKINGTGSENSTIEIAKDGTTTALSTSNKIKVDGNATLTYSGTEKPTKGNLILDPNSTLKTTQNDLDLGDSLAGQQGNLEVAGGAQSASALPSGTTTVDASSTLNFKGDTAPQSPVVVKGTGTLNFDETTPTDWSHINAEKGATIGLNHEGADPIDLSHMGGSGAIIKVGASQKVSALSTANTLDIPNGQSVTFTGSKVAEGSKLNLEDGGVFKTAPANGQTANLGNLLDNQAGKLEVTSGTTQASALPTGDSSVASGATLNFDGATAPDSNISVDGTLNYSGTTPSNFSKVTLKDGGTVQLSHASDAAVDFSTLKGNAGTVKISANQVASNLGQNTFDVDTGDTLTFNGDPANMASAKAINNNGKVLLTGAENKDWSSAIEKIKGGSDVNPKPTIEFNTDAATNVLSDSNTIKVDSGKTLTYNGNTAPGTGSLDLDAGATLKTTQSGLNLGDSLKGQKGNLNVASGNQSASSLPDGNTSVDKGAELSLTGATAPNSPMSVAGTVSYDGSSPANLNNVTLDEGGVLKLNHESSTPVDLSGVKEGTSGQPGTIEVAKNQTASALPSTASVKVDNNTTLTYSGDKADNLNKVSLGEGSSLVLNNNVGGTNPIDLGQVQGDKGTIVIDGTDQHVSALPTAGNKVVVNEGKTLAYDGDTTSGLDKVDLKPGANLAIDKTISSDSNQLDLSTIAGKEPGANIKLNASQTASNLPTVNKVEVAADQTLTYTGDQAPAAGKLTLDQGSILKTTHDGLDLGDSLKGQKGNLDIAKGTQTAANLPDGTTRVDSGATLKLSGDPAPTSPLDITGTVSYDNASPANLDNVTLNQGGLLKLNHESSTPIDMGNVKGNKDNPGTIEVVENQAASSLPGNATVQVNSGKTLTFSGDKADNLGSVTLQDKAKLALTKTVGTAEKPVDLNQIKGQNGEIDIAADQTANKLSEQNNVNVEAGNTLTYTGTDMPLADKLTVQKGGILATDPGAGKTVDLGDSLKGSQGTLKAQSGTQDINSLPAATDVDGGAILNYNGAQSPEGTISINNGTVNMNQTVPSNDALSKITIGSDGILSLNKDGSAPVDLSKLQGKGGEVKVNSNQSADNLGSIPVDVTSGNTLTYTGELSNLDPSKITNNGRFMIGSSGDLGDKLNQLKGDGAVGFGNNANVKVGSLGDDNIITVDKGASLGLSDSAKDKPINVQGLRLAGTTDLSNAGPVTITPKVDGKALTPYPWKGNSFAFKADRTAMITDGSDVTFSTNQANKSVGDFVVQGGSVTYGSTLTEGSQDRKLFEGLVLADNGAQVKMSATGKNASSVSDMAFIEANFNDHWTDHATVNINEGLGFGGVNSPAAPAPSLMSLRAATTSTNSEGQIELTLDNARWLNHGFSQLQTLVAKNAAVVDYNNAEHDSKAVAINNLQGSFELHMPLNSGDPSKSGQIYVVKGDGNSTITLIVPSHTDKGASALNDHIANLIKTPLRVGVLGNGTKMVLGKTDREIEVDGELYTYQLINSAYKAEATYDNGQGTLSEAQASKLFNASADQSYYLRLIKSSLLYAGISPAMVGATRLSQEMAYRALTRMDSMADHYEPGMPARAVQVWAKGGVLTGTLSGDERMNGWTSEFGVEGSKALGGGVLRVGLKGRVEGSKLSTNDTQLVDLKQTLLSAGIYTAYAHQGFYIGALGAYERLSQNSDLFGMKRTIQAAKATVETGVNLPIVDRFSVQPELQVQYTRWFGADFKGQYDDAKFKGNWKAGNSLQVRAALRFNKAQQLGNVDLNFHVTFGMIQELMGDQTLDASRDLHTAISRQYEVKNNYGVMQYQVGMDARLSDRFGLNVNVEQRQQLNSNAHEFRANAGLDFRF